jgi:hypothetical protein
MPPFFRGGDRLGVRGNREVEILPLRFACVRMTSGVRSGPFTMTIEKARSAPERERIAPQQDYRSYIVIP